jgi:signal recognition particle subunit SRP54
MFESITEKFQNLAKKLTFSRKLTEDNIAEAVREVRLALLDADVNYSVASSLVKKVKERSIGETVIKSVKPAQQFTKIVHDELVSLMGSDEAGLNLNGYPTCIMLCGLQGSGKTTQCVKLARYLQSTEKKKNILLVACDLQRPAAVEQLKKLASSIDLEVFSIEGEKNPRKVAKKALEKAKKEAFDIVIVDTAGRLHVDNELMKELKDIKDIINPHELLFVANATTGQDAVKTAAEFDKQVSITGSILTMLDGDARAGAAISIYEITKKPLKFEGVGEKVEDFQIFNPKSMADRILGMGDVINLVRKAEKVIDEKEGKELEKKFKNANFNFEDYLKQMRTIRRMGPVKSLLKMMPGFSSMSNFDISDKELKKVEAVILSMTKSERTEKVELIHSRRKRVADGSGVELDEVNRLIKGFKRMKQFMKKMPSLKKSLFSRGNFDMKKQMEDMKWP